MAKYRLMPNGVKNNEIGAFIPNDPSNRDWAEFQDWLSAGNVPDPEPPNREVNFKPLSKPAYELLSDDFEIMDAGIDGATEALWIKVRVGRRVAYLRGFAGK